MQTDQSFAGDALAERGVAGAEHDGVGMQSHSHEISRIDSPVDFLSHTIHGAQDQSGSLRHFRIGCCMRGNVDQSVVIQRRGEESIAIRGEPIEPVDAAAGHQRGDGRGFPCGAWKSGQFSFTTPHQREARGRVQWIDVCKGGRGVSDSRVARVVDGIVNQQHLL